MVSLKQAFENGEFAVTSEMAPPKGTDFEHLRHCASLIKGRVHAANVTDFQSAVMRASSLATCIVLQQEGIEPVIQITGRDRNRISIQGEMLSAGLFKIPNLLALTGDHTVVGDHPGAKPVYDLDVIGILQAATTLIGGKDMSGNELSGSPEFFLGASVTPRFDPIDAQIFKMRKKIAAGAKFFQTQAVFDIDTMRSFRELTREFDCKIMAGIIPLKSPGMAKFMNNNVPGIFVPEELIERLKSSSEGIEDKKEKNRAMVLEGIKISGEFIRQLKEENLCDGVHIMAIGAEENVPLILEAAGL